VDQHEPRSGALHLHGETRRVTVGIERRVRHRDATIGR
jgi:hypothetical protein